VELDNDDACSEDEFIRKIASTVAVTSAADDTPPPPVAAPAPATPTVSLLPRITNSNSNTETK